MSSVEDRLRERESQKNKEAVANILKMVEEYNHCIDELNVVISKIVKEIEIDPPDHHTWIKVEGDAREIAVWGFSFNNNNDDYSDSFGGYISSKGQIILRDNDGLHGDDGKRYYLQLNKIRSQSEIPVFKFTIYNVEKTFGLAWLIGIVYGLGQFYEHAVDSRKYRESIKQGKKHWWQ